MASDNLRTVVCIHSKNEGPCPKCNSPLCQQTEEQETAVGDLTYTYWVKRCPNEACDYVQEEFLNAQTTPGWCVE